MKHIDPVIASVARDAKIFKWILIASVVIVCLFGYKIAHAYQACWTPPTENVDGSALTDLAGYVIYFGVQTRTYESTRTLSVSQALESGNCYNVRTLPGVYYVAMTAFDADGNESAYSNEVLKTETQLGGPRGGGLLGPSDGSIITEDN